MITGGDLSNMSSTNYIYEEEKLQELLDAGWEICQEDNDEFGYEYMDLYIESNWTTPNAIKRFVQAGVTTNIHYVIGNDSIDDAILRMKNNYFPDGVDAVIFLLHKPVGLGSNANVLQFSDPKVDEFFNLVDNHKGEWKIGFDSCCVPGIINKTKNVAEASIDTCEAARFSCYITHDMKMIPCSFDNQDMKYAVDLRKHTIEEAWNSEQFMQFRATLLLSCLDCKSRNICMGGCPLRRQIVLCDRKEKDFA